METLTAPAFDSPDLVTWLTRCADDELDQVEFGVIGFDDAGMVCRYNTYESRIAGLSPARVLGSPLFTSVAPCMNNFMVSHRFEDALRDGTPLDVTIDYVFTLRMRPVGVRLRLLAMPGEALRHVIVQRRT
jgi:photoactive yellow protein